MFTKEQFAAADYFSHLPWYKNRLFWAFLFMLLATIAFGVLLGPASGPLLAVLVGMACLTTDFLYSSINKSTNPMSWLSRLRVEADSLSWMTLGSFIAFATAVFIVGLAASNIVTSIMMIAGGLCTALTISVAPFWIKPDGKNLNYQRSSHHLLWNTEGNSALFESLCEEKSKKHVTRLQRLTTQLNKLTSSGTPRLGRLTTAYYALKAKKLLKENQRMLTHLKTLNDMSTPKDGQDGNAREPLYKKTAECGNNVISATEDLLAAAQRVFKQGQVNVDPKVKSHSPAWLSRLQEDFTKNQGMFQDTLEAAAPGTCVIALGQEEAEERSTTNKPTPRSGVPTDDDPLPPYNEPTARSRLRLFSRDGDSSSVGDFDQGLPPYSKDDNRNNDASAKYSPGPT